MQEMSVGRKDTTTTGVESKHWSITVSKEHNMHNTPVLDGF